jgi:hypothetical protein
VKRKFHAQFLGGCGRVNRPHLPAATRAHEKSDPFKLFESGAVYFGSSRVLEHGPLAAGQLLRSGRARRRFAIVDHPDGGSVSAKLGVLKSASVLPGERTRRKSQPTLTTFAPRVTCGLPLAPEPRKPQIAPVLPIPTRSPPPGSMLHVCPQIRNPALTSLITPISFPA